MAKKHSMFHNAGKSRFVIPLLLLISLIANIFAISLPFLEIDEAFHKTVVYSLPHSVNLMWQHKLYAVSLLILCFSIIFPFVKLVSLFLVWFVPWDAKRRETFIHIIELLGKWSFMDIFVVILLIALTSGQLFIHSKIHIGVYFFVGAISLSMFLSQIILNMVRTDEVEPNNTIPKKKHWMLVENLYFGWTVPILVIASAASLIEAFQATFLQIRQFLLASHTYSIAEIGQVLQTNQQWVLLIVLTFTLAVIPLLRLAVLFVGWLIPMTTSYHIKLKRIIEGLSRWSMLDVFGLALFLVVTEGKDLVKTEIQSGLYVVLFAIGLSYFLGFVAVSLHKGLTRSEIISEAS